LSACSYERPGSGHLGNPHHWTRGISHPESTENTGPNRSEQLRIAVIVGSVREGRFGPTVANWFAGQAAGRTDMSADVVDLAGLRLPLEMPPFGSAPTPEAARALGELTPRLAAADAFVVVTPEYNHSFPASLKNAVDWHNKEWRAKPVGFVSYGGVSGRLRAVEQLRLVFAELHAMTVRDTVSFHAPACSRTPTMSNCHGQVICPAWSGLPP
jgi:NAD(P)H-dependent FMN reductase